MIKKINGSYNLKIDYKSVYFLAEKAGEDNYLQSIDIYYYNKAPKNKWGEQFCLFLQVFKKVSCEKNFNIQTLTDCAKKLNVEFDEKVAKNAVYCFNQQKGDFLIRVVKFLKQIIQNTLFKEQNDKIAMLIFNGLLKGGGYVPVIFTKSFANKVIKEIKAGADENKLLYFFTMFENLSERYLKKYSLITKDEVIQRILNKKQQLKKEFCVKNLWLYGSFVKNNETEYSDVDLLIEFKGQTTREQSERLKRFCEDLFQRRVDVQDVKNVINTAFYERISYKQKIISG